ncbi:MAG: DNA gyrase inhibitor YacG [Planctomycetes bacterium]|nr:DNA gyrase inhibitor YacG [Planctomycetota bacterium]
MRCPSCKRPVGAESPSFPFCSERCRWVDLAHWLEGTYRIEAALSEESAEDSLPQERAEEPDE